MSYRSKYFMKLLLVLPMQPYKAEHRGEPAWFHPPLNTFVNPPPLGIVRFLFKAPSFGPGLLGNIQGPRINDVATLARP